MFLTLPESCSVSFLTPVLFHPANFYSPLRTHPAAPHIVLVIHGCLTKHHNVSGLKQYTYMISHFLWVWSLAWLSQALSKNVSPVGWDWFI